MKQTLWYVCQEIIKEGLHVPNKPETAPAKKKFVVILQKGVAECQRCGSFTKYSPTSCKDIVIRCSNKVCSGYICTMNRCFARYDHLGAATSHQQQTHRANADPNKCYFCSAFKDRTTGKESDRCPKCGIFWCLVKNCTYEAVKWASVSIHLKRSKH